MADVNANIGVNIDSSNALAQLKLLQRQISQFHTSISKSSEAAALAQRDLQRNFINSVNSIGAFSAELRTVKTTAESFTDSLEKNKFSMREYFRYAGGATRTFGRLFKSEFDTINKVAEENVKRLQTQYIKMGRDASGAMRAIAIMPNELDMSNMSTQLQMAAQRQALFNQLVKQGSTNLLNFGKNTQWAGRQLMVGFTLPLMALGTAASKTFMDMETAALKFRKVYGDLFTPSEEREQALADITALGESFTRYGIAVSQTVGLAADAAAAGFQGLDLQRQVTEATRLQVLGQIDQQKALETTISLQNAFQMSSADLAESINFLNAVENQTVVSLDDITTAIPKAAPVVKQLGGNVKDLAFFMAAMKEGGINASEGANALKSGLASLINPTDKAREMMQGFGIDIDTIVNKNAGNVKQTVIEFAQALDGLSDLNRQRAIEQLFGKFQLARLSTLFENVTKTGNQASRVLDLATASTEELAAMAESELGMTAESSMNKFRKAVEDLKLALVPVGEVFIQAVTPILEFLGDVLDKFNGLSSGIKKAITVITIALGGIAPVALMTFGLLANFIANGIKSLAILRNGYLRLTGQSQVLGEQTQYLTVEQQNALAVAHSLDQSHARLVQTFTVESTAVQKLAAAYNSAIAAGARFSALNPGMMRRNIPGYKNGIISIPGTGTEDKYPAMLAAGEAVIPAKQNKKYAGLIRGIISDSIPGFQGGFQSGKQVSSAAGLVFAHGIAPRDIGKEIAAALIAAAPGLQQKAFSQATSMRGLTNFGFIAPEALNQGRMTGTQGASFFAKNTEMATSRILKSIYDLVPGSVNDPAVKKDVLLFGENISRELATAGSRAVSEQDFYMHVQNALSNTMKQAASGAFKQAMPAIQSQITTVAAYGGELNRGERGQRYALSRATQTAGLGYDAGMTSYKSGTLTKQVEKFGYTTGESAVRSVAVGAGTQSPSRKTIPIGEDIARGLQVGMQNQIDETAAAGQRLANAAVSGTQSGRRRRSASSPGGTVGSGGIIIPPGSIGTGGGDGPFYGPRKPTRFDKTFGAARGRIGAFASNFGQGKYAGAGFAASMAVSAGAMMPGKVGEVSQKAMPAIFGLQALQMALKLPIPHLKAFAAVTLAGIGIIKAINALREKERLAIEGLGDAANLSAEKMKGLGDFFGVVPTKSALGAELPQVAATSAQRAQIEQFRASGAAKQLAPEVKALTDATAKEAELALKSLAIKLKGSGFAEEQVKTIISYLQEEAGKTDVKIDLKSLDLTTKTGMKQLGNTARALAENVGKEFATGYSEKIMSAQSMATGEIVTWTEKTMSKGLKKSVNTAAQSIVGMIDGLRGQLDSGAINAEQFAQAFDQISKNIENMPQPQALLLTDKIFEVLPKKLGAAASGLTNISNRMLILEAKALGVTSGLMSVVAAMKILEGGAAYGPEGVLQTLAAEKTLDDFMARLKKARQDIQKLVEETTGGGETGGTKEKSAFQKAIEELKGQRTELNNTIAAYDKLKKVGMDTAKAFEYAKNPIFAAALATTKVGTAKWKELLALMEQVDKKATRLELKELFDTRTSDLNIKREFAKIVPLLQQMGLESEDIQDILSNPTLMQKFIEDLSDGAVDSERIKRYIEQIPDIKRVEIELGIRSADDLVKKIEDELSAIGSRMSQYFEAERKRITAGFAEGLKAAEAATEKIKNDIAAWEDNLRNANSALQPFLDQISALETQIADKRAAIELGIDQEIAKQTEIIQGINDYIAKTYDEPIAAMEESIANQRRSIEINFDRAIEEIQSNISKIQKQIADQIDKPIEALNKEIDNLQRSIEMQFDRPIAALQEESSDLANDLTLMDKAAEAINEKYDAQEKALQQISDINQDILNQEKQRMSIADALTRGDMAAAAQAIQEARAQAAATAAQRAGGTLAAARQAELEGLRGPVSGLTREQIQERQFQIGQQIFQLEEQREQIQALILEKQDKIYQLEQLRLPLLEKIKAEEEKIYALEQARAIEMRKLRDMEDALYKLQKDRAEYIKNVLLPEEKKLKELEEKRLELLKEIAKLELEILKIKQSEAYKKAQADIAAAEKKLAELQESLRKAELDKAKIEADIAKALEALDKQIADWEAIQTGIENAKAAAFDYQAELVKAQEAAKKLLDYITGVGDAESATITGDGVTGAPGVQTGTDLLTVISKKAARGEMLTDAEQEILNSGSPVITNAGAAKGTTGTPTNKISIAKQLADNTKIIEASTKLIKDYETEIQRLKALNLSDTVQISTIEQSIINMKLSQKVETEQIKILLQEIILLMTQQQEIMASISEMFTSFTGLVQVVLDKYREIVSISATILSQTERKVELWQTVDSVSDSIISKMQAYIASLERALSVAQAILSTILALNTTVITKHIIQVHTVYTSEGQPPVVPPAPAPVTAMYGGKIKPMAYGGRVGSDYVPALLTPGEFVVNKGAARRFGPLLNAINESKYPSMIGRNMSSPKYNNLSRTTINSPVQNNTRSVNDNSSRVYNYSVGINVNGTNANANGIARAVVNEIKYIDSQRIRGQRAR